MKTKKKNENGFTTVDIGIAMLVVMMFVTIMSSMLYNIYLSSTEAKRTAIALNYAVDIFEEIGQETFSELEPEEIFKNLPNLAMTEITGQEVGKASIATAKIGTYQLTLEMTKPYTDGTIKKFKLTISYPVSAKNTEKLELERIRTISRA